MVTCPSDSVQDTRCWMPETPSTLLSRHKHSSCSHLVRVNIAMALALSWLLLSLMACSRGQHKANAYNTLASRHVFTITSCLSQCRGQARHSMLSRLSCGESHNLKYLNFGQATIVRHWQTLRPTRWPCKTMLCTFRLWSSVKFDTTAQCWPGSSRQGTRASWHGLIITAVRYGSPFSTSSMSSTMYSHWLCFGMCTTTISSCGHVVQHSLDVYVRLGNQTTLTCPQKEALTVLQVADRCLSALDGSSSSIVGTTCKICEKLGMTC